MVNRIDTLSYLVGAWHLDRRITDHRRNVVGTYIGDADFVRTGDACGPSPVQLNETGELSFDSYRTTSTRSLRYVAVNDTRVSTYFDDGRHFIDLDLGERGWRSVHRCGRDWYDIDIRVVSPTCLEERWRVRGPHKEYDALTTLTRYGA